MTMAAVSGFGTGGSVAVASPNSLTCSFRLPGCLADCGPGSPGTGMGGGIGIMAMPSARALRSYLRSLARPPIPLRSLSPPGAARPARSACHEGGKASTQSPGTRQAGPPMGSGQEQTVFPPTGCPIVSHVLARSTPAGSSAPLRPGPDDTALARLDPPGRATVARSLRSLRPHHSRTPTGQHPAPVTSAASAGTKRTSRSGAANDQRRPGDHLQLPNRRSS